MKDIHKEKPDVRLPIKKVGIKGLKYPIKVMDKKNNVQHTTAQVNMFVDLPHHQRGTHMSRFVEIFRKYHENIHYNKLRMMLTEMKKVFKASCSHIEIEFPYFIEKQSPISKSKSIMSYNSRFICNLNDEYEFILTVDVPVLNLCPCSREISKYGAHNQRGIVKIKVQMKKIVWIEELVKIGEKSASSAVYSILKRSDEKYVTEHAYNHPRFAEDVVRKVAQKLIRDERVLWFSVEVENFESIHNHSAYALIESDSTES